jgi:hypothetical protein
MSLVPWLSYLNAGFALFFRQLAFDLSDRLSSRLPLISTDFNFQQHPHPPSSLCLPLDVIELLATVSIALK